MNKESRTASRGVTLLAVVVGVMLFVVLVGGWWWYLMSTARLPGPGLQQGIPGGVRALPAR